MPDMKYFDASGGLRNIVKDSVGMEDNLAQGTPCATRISRTDEREGAEYSNVFKNAAPYPMRSLRVAVRDVRAEVTKVRNCRVRPDYLEVHAVAQDSTSRSTSSWLFERPAAISARPRRTDAMMRNSSAISSREAPSGSLARASITACLSVIGAYYRIVIPKARDPRQAAAPRDPYAPIDPICPIAPC